MNQAIKPQLDWSVSFLLDILKKIFIVSPEPKAKTIIARKCAESIGLHLINLIIAASDANLRSFHSVSLALFRSMEDALDCFAAVTLKPDAAEKWANNRLKASEAAKVWDGRLENATLPTGERAIDYRKGLRSYLNNFAHCSPYLTDWNLYPDILPEEKEQIRRNPDRSIPITVSFHVNHQEGVLLQNAIRIGSYLAAHMLEFVSVIEEAYEEFLSDNPELKEALAAEKSKLEEKLKTDFGAVYLEDRPPQLQNLIIPHSTEPDMITAISLNPINTQ
jgi:hypothetical protein